LNKINLYFTKSFTDNYQYGRNSIIFERGDEIEIKTDLEFSSCSPEKDEKADTR
jgi:hypothetical protein